MNTATCPLLITRVAHGIWWRCQGSRRLPLYRAFVGTEPSRLPSPAQFTARQTQIHYGFFHFLLPCLVVSHGALANYPAKRPPRNADIWLCSLKVFEASLVLCLPKNGFYHLDVQIASFSTISSRKQRELKTANQSKCLTPRNQMGQFCGSLYQKLRTK